MPPFDRFLETRRLATACDRDKLPKLPRSYSGKRSPIKLGGGVVMANKHREDEKRSATRYR